MSQSAAVVPERVPRRVDLTTIVLLTLPPLIWGGNAVIGHAARDAVPPFHLNFLRWLFAGLALLPFVIGDLRRHWPTLKASWRGILGMGFCGVTCYNSFQYLALTTTSPINTSLIGASGPVFSLILGVLLFGARVGAAQVMGAAISIAGVVFVMMRGDPARLLAIDFDRGDLYMLFATLCWAMYTWLVRRHRPPVPIATALFAQIVAGLLCASPGVIYESLHSTHSIVFDGRLVAIVAYISLMASLLSYFCWDKGVARAGAELPMFFNNLIPVFAALISVVTLGEAPQFYHGVALLLIVLGIVMASRAKQAA